MHFLSNERQAVFLAYRNTEDTHGKNLPIIEDSSTRLVAEFNGNLGYKTMELAFYPDVTDGALNLNFSFNEDLDDIVLYIRARKASDINEQERPLVEIPVMFDSDDPCDEDVSIILPGEKIVIFVMLTQQLNCNGGNNTVTITHKN